MNRSILILSPTEIEIAPFRSTIEDSSHSATNCIIEICGIGATEAAANTASAIFKHRPDIVILAGIAGVYPDCQLAIGQSLIVNCETVADMGAFHEDGFKHKFAKQYDCPFADSILGFEKVGSNSVSACAAPFVKGSEQYSLENMEGAAFFAVCTTLGVPFLELRTVSNVVSTQRTGWNIPLATKELSDALIKLIDEVNS